MTDDDRLHVYVGEIRMFAGDFAPRGWMFCSGVEIPISENEQLFNLIGTTYGGDGQNTFALPNLMGRAPLHVGPSDALGSTGGAATVALTKANMPQHTHTVLGSTDIAKTATPSAMALASITPAGTQSAYGTDAPIRAISPALIATEGKSQPHENRQPYLVISYIIALSGIWPDHN